MNGAQGLLQAMADSHLEPTGLRSGGTSHEPCLARRAWRVLRGCQELQRSRQKSREARDQTCCCVRGRGLAHEVRGPGICCALFGLSQREALRWSGPPKPRSSVELGKRVRWHSACSTARITQYSADRPHLSLVMSCSSACLPRQACNPDDATTFTGALTPYSYTSGD